MFNETLLLIVAIAGLICLAGCDPDPNGEAQIPVKPAEANEAKPSVPPLTRDETPASEEAIFAGGCFWGVEHYLQEIKGVASVTSGYTGGHVPNPDYRQICTGRTGHAEAVRVVYDPRSVSYERLARLFFEIHDPTQVNRQGPDVGTQYRSAVFYLNDQQKEIAEKLIEQLRANGYNVATQLQAATTFYPAEDYHQDFLVKHPSRPVCHARVPRFDPPGKK